MRTNELDWVIDLRVYFPGKRAIPAHELNELESCFKSHDQEIPLRRWGGFWVTIHDAQRAYFSLPKGSARSKKFISTIVFNHNPPVDAERVEDLWAGVSTLRDGECLAIAIDRQFLESKVVDMEVSKCEGVDELLKVFGKGLKSGGKSKTNPLSFDNRPAPVVP
jgi:hypothetical protein